MIIKDRLMKEGIHMKNSTFHGNANRGGLDLHGSVQQTRIFCKLLINMHVFL